MIGIALLFLFFGLVFTVALYVLIKEEPASTTVTDREAAERNAQQFGGLGSRRTRPRQEATDRHDDGTEREDGDDEPWGYSRLDEERS